MFDTSCWLAGRGLYALGLESRTGAGGCILAKCGSAGNGLCEISNQRRRRSIHVPWYADGNPYSLVEILQGIKGASAHNVNRVLHSSGTVWQEESFDHVLRSIESFEEKVEYIRQNPVRRGLLAKAEDYRWLWVEQG